MGRKHKKIKHKPPPVKTPTPLKVTFGDREPEDILHEWPRSKQKIPQIFVHQPVPKDFEQHIRKLLTDEKLTFYQPYEGRYFMRMICKTFKDHRKMAKYLNKCEIPFHTYGYPKKRILRVIVKGLTIENDLKEVTDALRAASIPVIRIHYINTKKKTPDSSIILLIVVTHDENGRKLLNVTKILNKDVKIERPLPKAKQCFRCLKWGHAQKHCQGVIRCVKCAGKHWYNNCNKDRATPPKCANCGHAHVASYRKCPYCPDSIQYRNSQKKKMQNKKQTKPAISTAPQLATVDNYHQFLRKTKFDPTADVTEGAPGSASLPVNILGTASKLSITTTTEVTLPTTTEDLSHEAAAPEVKPDTLTTSKVKSSTAGVPKDEHVAVSVPEVEVGAVSKGKSDATVALEVEPGTAAAFKGKADATAFSKIKHDVSTAPKEEPGTAPLPKITPGTSAASKDESSPTTVFKIKPGGEAFSKTKPGTVVAPKVKPDAPKVAQIRPGSSAGPKIASGAQAVSNLKSDASGAHKDKTAVDPKIKSGASASPKVEPSATAVSKTKPGAVATPEVEPGVASVSTIKPDTSPAAKVKPAAKTTPKAKPSKAPAKSPKSAEKSLKKRT